LHGFGSAQLARITLQGLPAANTSSEMFFVTTPPAPITERAPIVMPGLRTEPPPIQTSSPMTIGFPDSMPERRSAASSGCVVGLAQLLRDPADFERA
jgi:hypothetical protein